MRVTVAVLACVLALPALSAADKGKGKGHDKNDDKGRSGQADRHQGGHGPSAVALVFDGRQREAARGWFAERYGRGNCPPGLARKNNGCLPPGQAKKRYVVGQPLPRGVVYGAVPRELAVRIGPAPPGYTYAMVDGDLLKLAAGTRLVADAIQGLVD